MKLDEIKRIVMDQNFHINEDFKYVKRDIIDKINSYNNSNLIIILTGLRRSGKSTILNILKKKSNNKSIYVNFDDFRFIRFSFDDFDKLNEIFKENENLTEFYFDEIQNIDYWERFVRTLHDNKNKIYITGSNASMLSTELGTHLTGRNIPIEIFPYSFREYLYFKKFKFEKNYFYLTSKIVKFKSYFNEYLKLGGIPEYLETGKNDYLNSILEDIINRDIIVRYNISNVKSLKDLVYYLVSNIGKEFSYLKLTNIIGIKNSTTIKEYIDYLENSYLLFSLTKFDYSLKKQLINPKKIYAIDTGLANSISFKFSEDRGRLLENLVFIELKRRGKEIYYHKNKKECDFVVKEGLNIVEAIQVCKSLERGDGSLETKKREIDGLLDACKTYGLSEGLILTEDEEGEEIREVRVESGDLRSGSGDVGSENGENGFEIREVRIRIMPIWKWLLSES